MLLPEVENTAPSVNIAAPATPMNSAAASASGVFDCASPGNVPSATTCTNVITIVTMTIVMISANGTSRRGIACFTRDHRDHLVAAEREDSSSPLADRLASDTLVSAVRRDQST